MTDEQLEIACELVTHPRWRWVEPMAWEVHRRAPLDGIAGRVTSSLRAGEHPYPDALPDLDDDATGGVLLGMIAEIDTVVVWAWADEARVLVGEGDVWMDGAKWGEHSGATLAEAAARALLACWGEP